MLEARVGITESQNLEPLPQAGLCPSVASLKPRRRGTGWGSSVSPEVGAQSLLLLFFIFLSLPLPPHLIPIPLAAPIYELRPLVSGAVHYALQKLHGFLSPASNPLTGSFANPWLGLPLTKWKYHESSVRPFQKIYQRKPTSKGALSQHTRLVCL